MRLLRPRLRGEDGFSFLELLIVLIVLGILAAVVLPFFTGQTAQGDDASAKSNASEVARAVEECGAETNDYARCATEADLDIGGLPFGEGRGEVHVARSARREFEVKATSTNGHEYTWLKLETGRVSRICAPLGRGGCNDAGTW